MNFAFFLIIISARGDEEDCVVVTLLCGASGFNQCRLVEVQQPTAQDSFLQLKLHFSTMDSDAPTLSAFLLIERASVGMEPATFLP